MVIRKSQFVDPGTQSQSVFVQVKNPSTDPVLAGEWLIAEFQVQLVKDVMEVNRNAVFNTNEIYTIVDGRLQKEVIEIVKINEKTYLFRGVSEGIKIVTQALINVMEGSAVSVIGDTPPKQQEKGQRNPNQPKK